MSKIWFSQDKIEQWILKRCRRNGHEPELAEMLTTSVSCYYYCLWIYDYSKIWHKLTDSRYAYLYCRDIVDRPEVRKNITSEVYAETYCRYIRNDIHRLRVLANLY